jgi:hypothetical protein
MALWHAMGRFGMGGCNDAVAEDSCCRTGPSVFLAARNDTVVDPDNEKGGQEEEQPAASREASRMADQMGGVQEAGEMDEMGGGELEGRLELGVGQIGLPDHMD